MGKVVFDELLIVDINNKKARIINFLDGKNLLTSAKNHLGKSLICKSLYYVLGAEVFFSDVWKKANALYQLKFTVGSEKYTIVRKNYVFLLKQENGRFENFYKIKSIQDRLNQIFDLKIMLVGKDGNRRMINSAPVFMYTPYYIDQENGWTIDTESFDRLSQFDKVQRVNALYYNLGVYDQKFLTLSLEHKTLLEEKNIKEKELNTCEQVVTYMGKILQENGDLIVNEYELNNQIKCNREKIEVLLMSLNKFRNEIIDAENNKAILIKEKDIIETFIRKENNKKHDIKTIICPKCEYEIPIDFKQRFNKQYLLETINEELSNIVVNIVKIDEQIRNKNNQFTKIREQLSALEKTISSDRNLYKVYLKVSSAKIMVVENEEAIKSIKSDIETLSSKLKILNKELKQYDVAKSNTDELYQEHLQRNFDKLGVAIEEAAATNYTIGDPISASGAYKDRTILSKYYAFLQTKHAIAKNVIQFPFVIDSPRGGEQDKENTKVIMDFILSENKLSNQIIAATIDGQEFVDDSMNINMIKLHNSPHSLLDADTYHEIESMITDLLLYFIET